jgi:hypothetical protein
MPPDQVRLMLAQQQPQTFLDRVRGADLIRGVLGGEGLLEPGPPLG